MTEYVEEVLTEEPDREIVQWMAPKPLTLGAGGISAAAAGAFALGAATAVAVLALMRWLGPEREPWRRRG